MTVLRSLLTLALLAPLTAHAAIIIDPVKPGGPGIPGGGGGGGLDPGGGGGGGGTTHPIWSKTYGKSDSFGSTDWGAGYSVTGNASATLATATTRDKLAANMNAEAYAKLNGGHYRIFGVRTTGATEVKHRTDVGFSIYAGSANIVSKSASSATSTYTLLNEKPQPYTSSFFKKSVTVTVLFVPVTFSVDVAGTVGATLTGKISNMGIEASGKPYAGAYLYTSAAIGGKWCPVDDVCVGASAGVYTDVRLVELSAPASLAVWWELARPAGVRLAYSAKADLKLSSLDGELGVFAEACYVVDCKRESWKLIDWKGFSATYPLINETGNSCIAGTCTITAPPGLIGF